ncbi:hypothetical protein CQW23_12899 [Capsicum baccatum]|uniref:TF-B3 domain-containing protein n=1 Tax=Capsicum baccatum TaxID=33114 RepID=A0A2G2WU24_CAPBA|nr:hypothetical protein CQW23_12899 [Capsicum baccatum]
MDNFIPSKSEEGVEERVHDVNPTPILNVENTWTISKVITDFEKSVQRLVLSFGDIKKHVFKHWMKDMVEHVKKGNNQYVELWDITEAVDPINWGTTYIQMMKPSKDYIVCKDLFVNIRLNIGDEIRLYWDVGSNNFKFKLI